MNLRALFLLSLVLVSGFVHSQDANDSERIFADIYKYARWGIDKDGQGTSGPGSALQHGKPFIDYVQEFLNRTPNVKSVVDIGCGDWVLAREINWGEREYLGIDVVQSLMLKNQSRFGTNKIRFLHSDPTVAEIPTGDLVICKDVLIHLPNALVFNLLSKFSKFKYCILVNDVSSIASGTVNTDIQVGAFRQIDLTCAPFLLKPKMISYYYVGSVIKQILLLENEENK